MGAVGAVGGMARAAMGVVRVALATASGHAGLGAVRRATWCWPVIRLGGGLRPVLMAAARPAMVTVGVGMFAGGAHSAILLMTLMGGVDLRIARLADLVRVLRLRRGSALGGRGLGGASRPLVGAVGRRNGRGLGGHRGSWVHRRDVIPGEPAASRRVRAECRKLFTRCGGSSRHSARDRAGMIGATRACEPSMLRCATDVAWQDHGVGWAHATKTVTARHP
ncbi:Hypothetical protein MexAM1_META1p1013 [Methylorubrum extorquens AM1]|uniref:Uncharacterized protein n=1 Tax=Methylorubrum extorquens (strain ATCC 14718 / DSM 1338 / JCM 2805 / NCIMB 9133 / AM1) TaxID=272630 RepID=C5AX68_METEA|nr:Hypothetical protein MexAM1_META1p1013 [Methylorubrum extorquens AM1]